eukprot:1143868-Pelagomonas_calceolata.AAC.2
MLVLQTPLEELNWLQLLPHSLTNTHTLPQTASAHYSNQLRKQIMYPKKHIMYREILCLKNSNLARTSQGHIFFFKVKYLAEIAGNEYADKVAKYQASLKDNNLTDTGIPSAGPGGNASYNFCLAGLGEARLSTSPSPI